MPYLPSEAAKKSKLYSNILNGAEIEYQKEIDFLKQQQAISGSVDANTPLRDDEGFLVSFEDPIAFGKADETEFEQITIQIKEKRFNEKYRKAVDIEFKEFINLEE